MLTAVILPKMSSYSTSLDDETRLMSAVKRFSALCEHAVLFIPRVHACSAEKLLPLLNAHVASKDDARESSLAQLHTASSPVVQASWELLHGSLSSADESIRGICTAGTSMEERQHARSLFVSVSGLCALTGFLTGNLSHAASCRFLDLAIIIGRPDYEGVMLARHALACIMEGSSTCAHAAAAWTYRTGSSALHTPLQSILPLMRIHPPSLLEFQRSFMDTHHPIIITGMCDAWTAMTKWLDPNYLLAIAGNSWVPVESGPGGYAHPDAEESLVQFRAYMTTHVLRDGVDGHSTDEKPAKRLRYGAEDVGNVQDREDQDASIAIPLRGCNTRLIMPPGPTPGTGYPSGSVHIASLVTPYLAQHDLLAQIPRLRADVALPDITCLAPSSTNVSASRPGQEEHVNKGDDDSTYGEVRVHCWIGPPGTVSSLHWDAPHNLLVQVVGRKRIKLYAPPQPKGTNETDTRCFYPFGSPMTNTSQVDPEAWATKAQCRDTYPRFPPYPDYDAVLEQGETLYIPPGWWHHVTALDSSISLSFWWGDRAPPQCSGES